MENLVTFWKDVIIAAFVAEMSVAVLVTLFGWRDVRDLLTRLSADGNGESGPADRHTVPGVEGPIDDNRH